MTAIPDKFPIKKNDKQSYQGGTLSFYKEKQARSPASYSWVVGEGRERESLRKFQTGEEECS